MLFEILGGLFGWAWIIGGIAVLIFVGLAVFSDGSWWNVFYAAVVSAVGKWLARGFNDNKKRVLFEQKLISEGVSKEDAGRRWTEEYGKGRT